MGDSMSKQGEKNQNKKVTFLVRIMTEYRVLGWFLPFLASIWFCGPFGIFFLPKKKPIFKKGILNQYYIFLNLYVVTRL